MYSRHRQAEAACIFTIIGSIPRIATINSGRYAVFACHIINYGTVCRIELSAAIKFGCTRVTGAEFAYQGREVLGRYIMVIMLPLHHAIKEIAQLFRTETAIFHFILDKLLNIDVLIKTAAGNRFSRSIKWGVLQRTGSTGFAVSTAGFCGVPHEAKAKAVKPIPKILILFINNLFTK